MSSAPAIPMCAPYQLAAPSDVCKHGDVQSDAELTPRSDGALRRRLLALS
jgi:hypothetical protein